MFLYTSFYKKFLLKLLIINDHILKASISSCDQKRDFQMSAKKQ